ncbi:hypothetical protein BH23PAT2_BH23PAT2_02490 [soil metagenome]
MNDIEPTGVVVDLAQERIRRRRQPAGLGDRAITGCWGDSLPNVSGAKILGFTKPLLPQFMPGEFHVNPPPPSNHEQPSSIFEREEEIEQWSAKMLKAYIREKLLPLERNDSGARLDSDSRNIVTMILEQDVLSLKFEYAYSLHSETFEIGPSAEAVLGFQVTKLQHDPYRGETVRLPSTATELVPHLELVYGGEIPRGLLRVELLESTE